MEWRDGMEGARGGRGSMCRVPCAYVRAMCRVGVLCAVCCAVPPLCCVLLIIILCRVLTCSVPCAVCHVPCAVHCAPCHCAVYCESSYCAVC